LTDIVNLNRFRKKKRADADEKRAAENRVKFGRTKAAKTGEKAERERLVRLAEGLRLDAKEDGDN